MNRLTALVAGMIVAGIAALAGGGVAGELPPHPLSAKVDSRAYDDKRVIEKKSMVMTVADDCSWAVIGESTFIIGSWRHEGRSERTHLLDSTGRSVKYCLLKPRDRVYVKGVARKDGTLFALVIQKR